MARSSGGGSRSGGGRSGGSRSSSSRSSSRSGSTRRIHHADGTYTEYSRGRITSDAPFPGARKFVYYRNGQPSYLYSNVDLRNVPDKKPRYFLGLFYIPFLLAFGSMTSEAISIPVDPMSTTSSSPIAIHDDADYFSTQEEQDLLNNITEFSQATGLVTQMVTVEWEEWQARANNFSEYALTRYYVEFSDEKGWLITYSEEPEGAATYADFEWEGIQGDETEKVLDVVIDDFNSYVQAGLIHETKPPAAIFGSAFQRATDNFNNQKLQIRPEELLIVIGPLLFILFHASIMIFAGTKQKYKAKELEEVPAEDTAPRSICTAQKQFQF